MSIANVTTRIRIVLPMGQASVGYDFSQPSPP